MNVIGLDIGYSNLKIAFGNTEKNNMQTKILPAGAAEESIMQNQLLGGTDDDSLLVQIDGESWIAGVEPYKLQGWERELHRDYPSSDIYKALFYSALLVSEMDTVDRIVTGLPVDQFKDLSIQESLKKRLIGTHQVTPKRKVTVKEVMIAPQPAGSYMDALFSQSDNEVISLAMDSGKMVVIDPGFFSVDWVVLQNGEIRYKSSGTSLKAMSMLLEEMQRLIKEDHGASPSVNELESLIRQNKKKTLLYGQILDLDEYHKKAAHITSTNALTPMRTTMREDGMAMDVVLLAGGGASSYEAAAREIFPRSLIIKADQSVLANARGFYHLGEN